jgi:hypothetical protein
MSCCGQKRRAWSLDKPTSAPAPEPTSPALQGPRVVYHQGKSSLLIKGEVTGFAYLFAGRGAGLSVDERDAPAFLAMDAFKGHAP